MKKVLLGTTAIVAAGMIASSPVLAAERLSVKVGGYMEQWFGYTSVDDSTNRDISGFDVKSDAEIFFTGSTVLDNGIEFGINVQLEANSNAADQIDESYLIIKGSFGEINLGSENSAMYKMHYAPSDVGISMNSGDQADWAGAGQAGVTTYSGYFRQPYGSTYLEPGSNNDTEKLTYYTPRFGGFQLGASYSPDNLQDNNTTPNRNAQLTDMVAFGANFQGDFAGAKVGVSAGWGTFLNGPAGADKPQAYNFGLTLGFGGFEAGASYGKTKDSGASNGDSYNIGIAYRTGPMAVSLAYFNGDRDGTTVAGVTSGNAEQKTVHLSGAYTLGPGVVAAATLGHAKFDTRDTGVSDIEATYFVTGIKLSF